MSRQDASWAIVLAGGDGTRLSSVTRLPDGSVVPKQFFTQGRGRSLFQATIRRAWRLVSPARVVAVVAEQHRRFWEPQVGDVPGNHVVVQPANRGTAPGLLLPLLHVMARDPAARALVLPSDHGVAAPQAFELGLRRALKAAADEPRAVALVGIAPDSEDADYGWIVPGARSSRTCRRIEAFVEKPDAAQARLLREAGGCWSSFILAGRIPALLSLYQLAKEDLLEAMLSAAHEDGRLPPGPPALRELYERLPGSDFSRDVLAHPSCRERLRVVLAPPCGWSDLGTPERLASFARSGEFGHPSGPAAGDRSAG